MLVDVLVEVEVVDDVEDVVEVEVVDVVEDVAVDVVELVFNVVTVASDEVVEAGVPTPAGGGFHPRKVVPAHEPESMLLRRPHSLWSIDNPQRAFTAIQLAT